MDFLRFAVVTIHFRVLNDDVPLAKLFTSGGRLRDGEGQRKSGRVDTYNYVEL